jgi:hypothetical protein
VRKIMRKRGRGTAAALAIPMGMAPIHPKSPSIKNEWVGCPHQLSNAGVARRQTTVTHYGRLDAGSSNERGRSGRHRDLHRLIAAEGAT